MRTRLSSAIELIDTMHFGRPRTGAAYYVHAEKNALIETGTSLACPSIVESLGGIDLDYIFVTHVHLDHAGGAGYLAREYPEAEVVVHQRGARHLVEPTRLVESVRTVTGDLFSHYGEVLPVPGERIHVAKDGERFDLGQGIAIEAVETPGHAPHHLCFFEHGAGGLFTGDAAGILHQGKVFPATPPPNFDLELSLKSLEQLRSYRPKTLYYTHFGPVDDALERLARYGEALEEWVHRIRGLRERMPPEEVVREILADPALAVRPDEEPTWALEVAMAVRGVLHYLGRNDP